MSRIFIFLYGTISYLIFFLTFLYAIGFLGNIFVTNSIDSGGSANVVQAIVIDSLLLGLFAVQHSVMARPGFKRWLVKFIPQVMERSTYVLCSSLVLILLFALWQPIDGTLWQVQNSFARFLIYILYAFGWLLVLLSTFLINHFDLFGLQQVYYHLRDKPYPTSEFVTPWLYKYVRHPLYVGWFFAFWATPVMTVSHFIFSFATAVYILIAIQLEERDLEDELGQDYTDYRRQVPMLIPFSKIRKLPSK